MATRNDNDAERSAAGMDYDNPIREQAHHLGSTIAENGPEALFPGPQIRLTHPL